MIVHNEPLVKLHQNHIERTLAITEVSVHKRFEDVLEEASKQWNRESSLSLNSPHTSDHIKRNWEEFNSSVTENIIRNRGSLTPTSEVSIDTSIFDIKITTDSQENVPNDLKHDGNAGDLEKRPIKRGNHVQRMDEGQKIPIMEEGAVEDWLIPKMESVLRSPV